MVWKKIDSLRMHSAIFEGNAPAAADDVLVRRLRAAGAIVIAKSTTPEFGVKGLTTMNLRGPYRMYNVTDHDVQVINRCLSCKPPADYHSKNCIFARANGSSGISSEPSAKCRMTALD